MIGDLLNLNNKTDPLNKSTATPLTGTLAKLASEIKLIEGMQMIRINGSRDLVYQQKPVQLIEITTPSNKNLSLINTGSPVDVKPGQIAKLEAGTAGKAQLITPTSSDKFPPSPPAPNTAAPHSKAVQGTAVNTPTVRTNTSVSPQTSNIHHETQTRVKLASAVIPLKVLSSTNVSSPTPQVNNSNQPTQGNTTYNIQATDGKNTFNFQSKEPISPGTPIKVMIDGDGKVQVLPPASTPQKPAPLESGLSQSLPKQLNQQEMTTLIKNLSTLTQLPAGALEEKVRSAVNQLLQSIPTAAELSKAPELKSSLQQSGLFMENNLAKLSPTLEKDVKLNLLKLQQATGNSEKATPEILNQVSKAVERITTHQLRNLVELAKTDQQMFPLQMELPVRYGNESTLIQFDIDRDPDQKQTQEKEKRRWLVKLRFDFPETGKFEARLSIQERKAGLIFVAEEKNTEYRIREAFDGLRQSLRASDIEVERLDCFCSPLQEQRNTPNVSNRLIDVRT